MSTHFRNFCVGDLVRHFKFETLSTEEQQEGKYVYKIIAIGEHTETGEKMYVYRSLYDQRIWIRPANMFESEVDKSKYPNIKQKYRLELVV